MHEYDVYFGMVPTNLANLTNWEITHAGINSEHIRQPAKFCNQVCYLIVSIPDLCTLTYFNTPTSNLGYPAPQDNFSWMPNSLLGPPGCETKVSSKFFWFGLFENAWFPWQPIADLRMGVCLLKYSYLSCYLS